MVAQKQLIVFVPGFAGLDAWDRLRPEFEQDPELSGEQVSYRVFDHGTTWRSRRSLDSLAEILNGRLGGWYADNPDHNVVLIGHSLGGMLVRRAYLDALVGGKDWARAVKRIVLVASPNRGIKTRKDKRRDSTTPLPLYLRLGYRIVRMIRRFSWGTWTVLDLERGSPFVTDLRISWIRHLYELGKESPLIVQVLGEDDRLVKNTDIRDAEQFPNAVEEIVEGAGHRDPHDLGAASDSGMRASRYRMLRRAVFEPYTLRPFAPPPGAPPVVFLVHGIRASKDDPWMRDLSKRLETRDPQAVVLTSTYGWLSALGFAIPALRGRNIRWLQDKYSYYVGKYPTSKFYFVGHSNGTYILGRALRDVPSMQFERAFLAGTVLPRDHEWQTILDRDQLSHLRSDRANRDYPVAVLSRGLRVLRMRDIGAAGFVGFDFDDTRTSDFGYHDGGHSSALDGDSNRDSIVDYIMDGATEEPPGLVPSVPASISWFSRIAKGLVLAGLIAVLAVVAGTALLVTQAASAFWGAIVAATLLLALVGLAQTV